MDKAVLKEARKQMEKNLLMDLAYHLERVEVRTPSGGQRDTWVESDTQYKCRVMLRPVDVGERQAAGGVLEVTHWIIKLPWDAPILIEDRLRVNDVTYNVHLTNSNQTERLLLECFCSVL